MPGLLAWEQKKVQIMRLASRPSSVGAWLVAVASVLLAFASVWPGEAQADGVRVRLIMVDDPACRFCRKWEEVVGRGYAKSAEGRIAPLKRVRRGARELSGLAPVIYTPTFIVMRDDGGELGRISGFSGSGYFYEDLRDILARAGALDSAP